tara:strand:- start:419 stop:931 length:513 start_codon:yes stop_codon:yes gene_type:complete
MSALRLLNETIADNVSSVNVTDVFSADYDIYKIAFTLTDKQSSSDDLSIRLINASGSVISASDYDRANFTMTSNTTFGENKSANTTSFFSHAELDTTSDSGGAISYLFNAFDSSSYTFHLAQSSGFKSTGFVSKIIVGVYKNTNKITGFNYFADSGTFSATIRTYGLRVE